MPAPIIYNRIPLPENNYAALPPTAIRPEGWVRERLADRAPQTLHERLLTACLLQDAPAMDAVQAEILTIMAENRAPTNDILRALRVYHGVTSDKDAAVYLLRALKALRERLTAGETLPAREAADIGDWLATALWLYNFTGQKSLLELCRQIKAQAPDWMSTFHIFAQTKPVEAPGDPATDAYWRVHGPTIAANLKTPALQALFEGGLKNETAFETGWQKLTRHHGAAHGLFGAEPLLAGAHPARGVDAAVLPELLHTLQTLLWAQPGAQAADLMAQTAYGPLQMARGRQAANQLLPRTDSIPDGFATWAAAQWMATRDGGLCAAGYIPSQVRWRVGETLIRVQVETGYPYEEEIRLRILARDAVAFPLHLHIPAWAEGAYYRINDEIGQTAGPGGFTVIDRTWQNGDTVLLTLPMQPRVTRRFHQSISVECGPLIYALPVTPDAPWNLALLPERGFERALRSGIPVLLADAAPVSDWRKSGDVPAAPPVSPRVSADAVRRVELIPYGEAPARIAQFPAGILQSEPEGEQP